MQGSGGGSPMRRLPKSLALGAAMATIACPSLPVAATAAPSQKDDKGTTTKHRSDNRPGPQTVKHLAKRAAAQKLVAEGRAVANAQGVVQLPDGTYTEVETATAAEKTDKIFTILAEFGDQSLGRYGTVP